MTLGDALARATARLAAAGVESARLEAELLLAKACDDCARALLYAELDRELTDVQIAAFDANISRRETARAAGVRARRVGLPPARRSRPTAAP